jgi:hypothetical protein
MTVCLPAVELVNIDAMASVDNVPAVSTVRGTVPGRGSRCGGWAGSGVVGGVGHCGPP